MTPTKPGDLLGKLSADWRKECDRLKRKKIFDGQRSVYVQCANQLDAALAQLRPVMEKLVHLVGVLQTEVIIGYENEQQASWPDHMKLHQCEVCYESAKRVRAALAEYRKVLHGE